MLPHMAVEFERSAADVVTIWVKAIPLGWSLDRGR